MPDDRAPALEVVTDDTHIQHLVRTGREPPRAGAVVEDEVVDVRLVGVDHVGIGSDFDGVQATAADLGTIADLPNLTRELLKRGYSESDVDKILGGNMLRVMEASKR